MKVTKKMVDSGLRPSFGLLKLIAFMLSHVWGINILNGFSNFLKGKKIKGLYCEERYIPGKNGDPDIRIRIFKRPDFKGKLHAVIYYHGGGYVMGVPELYLGQIRKFIETRACVVIAPDYRKALKAPFPAAFNDCYDTLLWVKENAEEIGVYDHNFIVAGHSAGGGLTAAVTLKARDTREINIAFQMPIYPMIDDRQITESARDMKVPVWNSRTNAKGWDLYLKGLKKNNTGINAYAAPARNKDYSNFPPTITFVGELEPFRDETIEYVEALKNEGIPVEFKFYKACFHGFDAMSPKSAIAKDALNFTYHSFAKYFDRFCTN